jgi:AcrR family transcriptional regulator
VKRRRTATKKKPRTREEAKQASREALVQAATELFAREGLDVSLDELCARAGYTRGAFYVHFKDRDELLLAVMERVGRSVLDVLLGPAESRQRDDLMAISQRFLQALVSGKYPLTKKGGMRPHQLLDACARSPAIRDQYVSLVKTSIERLGGSIRESQRLRQVRGDADADQLAGLLLALVIGVHTLYDLNMPFDLQKGALTLFQLMAPVGAER